MEGEFINSGVRVRWYIPKVSKESIDTYQKKLSYGLKLITVNGFHVNVVPKTLVSLPERYDNVKFGEDIERETYRQNGTCQNIVGYNLYTFYNQEGQYD